MNPLALARFAAAIAPDVTQLVRALFTLHRGEVVPAKTTIRRIQSYALEMQRERRLTDQAIADALKNAREGGDV